MCESAARFLYAGNADDNDVTAACRVCSSTELSLDTNFNFGAWTRLVSVGHDLLGHMVASKRRSVLIDVVFHAAAIYYHAAYTA